MKNKTPIIIGTILTLAAGAWFKMQLAPGVADRYEAEVEAAQTERALPEQTRLDAQMLGNLLTEVDAIEAAMRQMNATHLVSENASGIYTVEQEQDIAESYSHYLTLRRALFHIAFRHMDYAELEEQTAQDESFLLAYASGLSLYRNAVLFVVFFKDQPNARRKLNEADPVLGIPAGTFDEMYANITSPANVKLVLNGVEELGERRERLEDSTLLEEPGMAGLMALLDSHEAELAAAYEQLAEGTRDVLWSRVKSGVAEPAYEAQSFVSVMVGHIRTPLHAPGFSEETINTDIRPLLLPGDILLTRSDGYLSNTFLPGNWGHAAMYLGSPDQLRALGESADLEAVLTESGYDGNDKDGQPFSAIEAIGEGVRLSSLEFALHTNLLAVLRPTLSDADKQTAAIRAIKLKGTPYDFSFDVSSQDKIICTELVYRAYSPHLNVSFEEVMGRKTLKPDGMLKELSPAAEVPRTELVVFGSSDEGALKIDTLEALVATVADAP
ncbi:MAG: hypothetical protein ACI8RZ_002621 [Myxococcota bacterium]|jgi:hypothetical protein